MALRLGNVTVSRPRSGALGAVLVGTDADGRPAEVALAGASLGALAALARDAVVEVDDGRVCIVAGAGRFEVVAASAHVHRDLSAAMRAAIPARGVPWARRVFWFGVLALARSRAGLRLLQILRRG